MVLNNAIVLNGTLTMPTITPLASTDQNHTLDLENIEVRLAERLRDTATLPTTSVAFYFKFPHDVNAAITHTQNSNGNGVDDYWLMPQLNFSRDFSQPSAQDDYLLPDSNGAKSTVIGSVDLRDTRKSGAAQLLGIYDVVLSVSLDDKGKMSSSVAVQARSAVAPITSEPEDTTKVQIMYVSTTNTSSAFGIDAAETAGVNTSTNQIDRSDRADNLHVSLSLSEVTREIQKGVGNFNAIVAIHNNKYTVNRAQIKATMTGSAIFDSQLSKFARTLKDPNNAALPLTSNLVFAENQLIKLSGGVNYNPKIANANGGAEIDFMEDFSEVPQIFAVIQQKSGQSTHNSSSLNANDANYGKADGANDGVMLPGVGDGVNGLEQLK